jgi:general secretion pathway protein E
MKLKLTPIQGQAKSVLLGQGASATIGRGPENTIPIIDERASRQHCVLEHTDEGDWVVRDLGSRNGTKVNQVRIDAAAVRPGDVIRVGSHEFMVEFVPESASPGAAVATGVSPPVSARPAAMPQSKAASAPVTAEWLDDLFEALDNLPPLGLPEAMSIIDAHGKPTDVLNGTTDGPTALRLCLQLASKARATDLHVEPKGDRANLRMRVDGDMVSISELPKRVGELMFGVVKSACHMHVAGRDAMQEGHFSAIFPDRRVEYRISFTPSMYGQKLVVRILDQRGAPSTIGELGMVSYMEERIRHVCEQDSGLILTCGPTGSGKTTTLYTAIRTIDRVSRNVITIEDPVEYQLDHVTQIPIDEHKGNTFGSLLRSVLRQDPDVILVGEIRDEETARTAMQAALTGHLVFSSVHAKESISAVFRLLDLKVEPYLVANSLNLVLAQRLVRVLCPTCRRPTPVSPGQATRIGRFLQGKSQVYTATGCAKCLRTGYRGRRALFELLDFNDELRDIVLTAPSIVGMKKVIEQGLFTTLQQFGWRLAAEGITSLDEVDRVAGIG